jgi:hypothetical protein
MNFLSPTSQGPPDVLEQSTLTVIGSVVGAPPAAEPEPEPDPDAGAQAASKVEQNKQRTNIKDRLRFINDLLLFLTVFSPFSCSSSWFQHFSFVLLPASRTYFYSLSKAD